MRSIIILMLFFAAQLMGANLCVTPEEGLVDTPIAIRAEGLTPGEQVQLMTGVCIGEKSIGISKNTYLVDEKGGIDA